MPADRVKGIITDVDGVLTDGHILIDDAGNETKIFHVWDGSAAAHLRKMGIPLGIVTGRKSRALLYRAREMQVADLYQGHRDKLSTVRLIAEKWGVALDELAYIGDDVLDIRAMAAVGFAVAPANARPEVKAVAHYIATVNGGDGVLREVAELVLRARGLWDQLLAEYLPEPQPKPEAPAHAPRHDKLVGE